MTIFSRHRVCQHNIWMVSVIMVITRRVTSWRRYPPEDVPIYTSWVTLLALTAYLRRSTQFDPVRDADPAYGWLGEAASGGQGSHGGTVAALVESRLSYTTRYFSLYDILVQNPFRNPKSIAELASKNVLELVSRSLFIGGGITYPTRDEVLVNLQVPLVTGRLTVICVPGQVYQQLGHPKGQDACQQDLPRCLRPFQRGSAAGSCLRLSGLKRRVEIWTRSRGGLCREYGC